MQTTPPPAFDDAGDATRRTWLANERTWLAWVRTGLTATAVSLAMGRVVPELSHIGTRWPYEVVGVGYALYGVALVVYGFVRRRDVQTAIVAGGYVSPRDATLAAFAVAGAILGLATAALVAVS